MNYIKTLAKEFLSTASLDRKAEISNLARGYLHPVVLSDKTPSEILKHLGVSYFGAINSSQKTEKGKMLGYDSYIVYLSPSDLSGVQVCRFASEGCRAACLNLSGRALMAERSGGAGNDIAVSRLVKTWLLVYNREAAEKVVCFEIARESRKAEEKGNLFSARLNGTSDIFWGRVIRSFPDVQFYDYTKNPAFLKLSQSFPNWHLTFSFSGANLEACRKAISMGINIAFPVVGKKDVAKLIAQGKGFDMDKTDLRFLDTEKGVAGILTVKETPGTAEGIEKGFLLSPSRFLEISEMLATNNCLATGLERSGRKEVKA